MLFRVIREFRGSLLNLGENAIHEIHELHETHEKGCEVSRGGLSHYKAFPFKAHGASKIDQQTHALIGSPEIVKYLSVVSTT